MNVVGIDPGLSGAFAWLDDDGNLLDVQDMPIRGEGKQRRVDGLAVANLMADRYGDSSTVVTELVHSMPAQGVASTFKFGQSYGVVLAVGDIYSDDKIDVRPQAWKKHFGLIGKDKDAARLLVLDKFPKQAEWFLRKKDQGRADATLVALWAIEHINT